MTRIYLYGSNNFSQFFFPDPGNWNMQGNKIECVGSGSYASQNYFGGPPDQGSSSNNPGGGAGSYAFTINSNLPFPVQYTITQSIQAGPGMNWPGATWGISGFGFNPPQAADLFPGVVYTSAGSNYAPGSTPGPGSILWYPEGQGARGGDGGAVGSNSGAQPGGPQSFPPAGAGGGGGAGGPNGPGTVGQSGTATTFGAGGKGDAGNTSGGVSAGQAGSQGKEWDNIHGCGGGGAGTNLATSPTLGQAGGSGGYFGGAGGGSSAGSGTGVGTGNTNGPNGAGTPGLVVVTYQPNYPAGVGQFMV